MLKNILSILFTVTLMTDSFQLKNNKTLVQLEACKYQLPNGKIIDLKKLDNPVNPKEATLAPWIYRYNPCKIYFHLRI